MINENIIKERRGNLQKLSFKLMLVKLSKAEPFQSLRKKKKRKNILNKDLITCAILNYFLYLFFFVFVLNVIFFVNL